MKYIVSVAAWTSGLLALPVACVVMRVIGPRLSPARVSSLGRGLMRIVLKAFWVRSRVEGLDRLDPGRPYLFMANHASLVDFFLLGAYLPGTIRGIEAAEHFSWPFWAWFLKGAGMIPIDRSNPRASLRAIKQAAEYLRKGISILILPEGTRSLNGRLLPFKKLPFRLARMGGAAIVPVGLVGTFRVKPKTTWLFRPGLVTIRFGEPIPAEEVARLDEEALAALTRRRIAALAELDGEGS